MNQSSGVGGTGSPTPNVSEAGGPGDGGQDISGLMQAKVSNLGELKALMISHLGEEEGSKFYNQFMNTFAMSMIQQVQKSAQSAKKAAHSMRMQR